MVVMNALQVFSGLEFRKPWRRGVVEKKVFVELMKRGRKKKWNQNLQKHISNEILHRESFLREDIRNHTVSLAAWLHKVAKDVL